MNFLFFDTETTGIPRNYNAPVTDTSNWPRLVQIGWIVYNGAGEKQRECELIVKPEGFTIPEEVSKIHGITQDKALEEGWDLVAVLSMFCQEILDADTIVGHNLDYDYHIVGAEFVRLGFPNYLEPKSQICTMKSSTDYCKIPGGRNGYKWPKLHELYFKLFGEVMEQSHTALDDIQKTAKCYFELKRLGVI